MGPTGPMACFYKYGPIGTQPHLLVYILFVAACTTLVMLSVVKEINVSQSQKHLPAGPLEKEYAHS